MANYRRCTLMPFKLFYFFMTVMEITLGFQFVDFLQ